MNKHSEIQNQLEQLLSKKGIVFKEHLLEIGNKKYRSDLLFENIESHLKVIIEIKSNFSALDVSIGTLSYLVDLKELIDHMNYRMVVVFSDDLTESFSQLLRGRIAFYSLQDKTINEIAELIYNESEQHSIG